MRKEIEKVNFCQPDNKHYCLECCRGINCCLIGSIENDKMGCTIHPDLENKDTSIKIQNRRPLCESVNCWINFSVEEKIKLLEVITNYKEPEFRMDDALDDAGIKRRIEP